MKLFASKPKTVTFLLITTTLATIIGALTYHITRDKTLSDSKLQAIGVVIFKTPRYFSIENLIDHNNVTFNKQRFLNKWSLLYFGYTSCPDICPATLSQLNTLDKTLKQRRPYLAQQMQYIMATVDPTRDTQKKLSQYMLYFNPSFIGLTGLTLSIYNFTQQFNIPYIPAPEDSKISYLVDHSANLIIINPRGDYHGYITSPFDPKNLFTTMNSLALNTTF